MRAILPAGLALAALLSAAPAQAQVQRGDPNAASQSFTRQGEIRSLQLQQTAEGNAIRAQMQRDVQYRGPDSYGPGLIIGRRGAVRSARGRGGRGFDTGVCVGC